MRGGTALVTGGSRGIGLAIASRLRQDGLTVLTPSRDELDLLSNESIRDYLRRLREPLDVLVNDAGINHLGGVTEVSDSDISDTLQVNLVAPVLLIRGIAPNMIKQRYGRIVNISSIWSLVSKPRRVTYAASKSGLNGVTRTLALELGPFNILVNAVAPGFVDTAMTRQNNTEKQLEALRRSIPLQRLAEPSEIAEVVAFLCSEKNTYITGQIITVDGGLLSGR